tara:strand:- start:7552 stop:7758 length:207 start_codon:yes stop_codon:yes gene_type:complete
MKWVTALLKVLKDFMPLLLAYSQGRNASYLKHLEKEIEDAHTAQKISETNSTRTPSDASDRLRKLRKG